MFLAFLFIGAQNQSDNKNAIEKITNEPSFPSSVVAELWQIKRKLMHSIGIELKSIV